MGTVTSQAPGPDRATHIVDQPPFRPNAARRRRVAIGCLANKLFGCTTESRQPSITSIANRTPWHHVDAHVRRKSRCNQLPPCPIDPGPHSNRCQPLVAITRSVCNRSSSSRPVRTAAGLYASARNNKQLTRDVRTAQVLHKRQRHGTTRPMTRFAFGPSRRWPSPPSDNPPLNQFPRKNTAVSFCSGRVLAGTIDHRTSDSPAADVLGDGTDRVSQTSQGRNNLTAQRN